MEAIENWWNTQSSDQQIVLLLAALAVGIQVIYDLVLYARLALYKTKSTEEHPPGVSIIICARNEERKLRNLIPEIMEQDHPDFEVIVVDDSSWDDSTETLRAYQVRYSKLHLVRLDEDRQRMSGKKFALTVGLKAAKKELVLLTDADCRPVGKSWARHMTLPFLNPSTDIVLGVSPYARRKGLLNRVIRYDAAQIAIQYLSQALIGIPYMGVGRNLAYRTNLFFSNGGFKNHLHIASGDDDLFVKETAKKGNTAIVIDPETHVLSDPKESWSDWMHQKRRHFTTSPHYRLKHQLILGLWPLSYYLMWLFCIVLMVVHNAFLIGGSLLLLRYIIHLATFSGALGRVGEKKLIAGMPLWECLVWLIGPALWIWNLLATPRTWK